MAQKVWWLPSLSRFELRGWNSPFKGQGWSSLLLNKQEEKVKKKSSSPSLSLNCPFPWHLYKRLRNWRTRKKDSTTQFSIKLFYGYGDRCTSCWILKKTRCSVVQKKMFGEGSPSMKRGLHEETVFRFDCRVHKLTTIETLEYVLLRNTVRCWMSCLPPVLVLIYRECCTTPLRGKTAHLSPSHGNKMFAFFISAKFHLLPLKEVDCFFLH